MNRQGRPSSTEGSVLAEHPTFTGNRALAQEEPLLFEIGRADVTGVDLDEPEAFTPRLGGLERTVPIGLPGLSEPETMRHYVRLSQQNYGIDTGLFPLGSCTMKHNARLNEKMARLPGFGDVHPLQPVSTVQGALELMAELSRYLTELTGMPAVALQPKAGAHGELCGLMAIKAAIAARGEAETRNVVLVPESAHGTNPATAALIGFKVRSVPARDDGWVHIADVRPLLGPDIAAIMLTNPNTCGLFEPRAKMIADALHECGGYFYCDGANFNAIVGKVRPGDLGVDAMHINLHKTFSTPHGGGGPGAGPVVLSERLAPYAPVPFVVDVEEVSYKDAGPASVSALVEAARGRGTVTSDEVLALRKPELFSKDGWDAAVAELRAAGIEVTGDPSPLVVRHSSLDLIEDAAWYDEDAQPFGRMVAFHGQMGMFVRALAYMLSHGADGMRQASEDAVLGANYIRASLSDLMSLPFGDKPCMHEVLFDDTWLADTGVTTLDFAKAMIDEGYHPMTMYFPLVVHGAMLIEPTESESKASLDLFIAAMRDLAMAAKAKQTERFKGAPFHAPRRRLDETGAARKPVLRWTPPAPVAAQAAE
ncbi:aminomethyl-transferring glycine dehydrogenase subunit GcvPB [Enterovirga rhinocerotis]